MSSTSSAIWKRPATVEMLNEHLATEMLDHLDIVFTELGPDYLKGTMPVDHRTRQPLGILHGGASAVLAESLGSVAANLCLEENAGRQAVGLEINANHVRSVRSGTVEGTATPVHRGRTTQIWSIRIEDAEGRLVSVSRLTLLVVRNG